MKTNFFKKEPKIKEVLLIVMVMTKCLPVSSTQNSNGTNNLEGFENVYVLEGNTTDCPLRKDVKYNTELRDGKRLSLTNPRPELVEITVEDSVNLEMGFLWYVDFANTSSPAYHCLKLARRNFLLRMSPNIYYLVCLMTIDEFSQMNIFDCLPLKTQPHYEDQTWLTNKSISLSVFSITALALFALLTGALILYWLVRKNPSLIRGSKRVIEVKRHDKAQVLIMPRGYEGGGQTDSALLRPLQPSLADYSDTFSIASHDTLSTVSYVSAIQPTQMEILTYRFNRLREIFQRNNNLPPPVPAFPLRVSSPPRERIPPNVDLLFEYEWYTITTTTTTQP